MTPVTREDLGVVLEKSKSVYFQRVLGLTQEWSATTRCAKCGTWWMWGVKDSLNFTCNGCRTLAITTLQ